MSTSEAKVDVIYDFLVNRASLGRTTNLQEIAAVISPILVSRQERRREQPLVRREKIKAALDAVDNRSWSTFGVLLSPLVAHFWDTDLSRATVNRAQRRGLSLKSAGQVKEYQDRIFNQFSDAGVQEVRKTPKPKTVQERPVRNSNTDSQLVSIQAKLAELTREVEQYVGRHRSDAVSSRDRSEAESRFGTRSRYANAASFR